MGKPAFGLFQGRRKSSSNALENADPNVYLNPAPAPETPSSGGGFRVLERTEIERVKREQAAKKPAKTSAFGRFGHFGAAGSKGRTQSVDDDSPSSSKRYV